MWWSIEYTGEAVEMPVGGFRIRLEIIFTARTTLPSDIEMWLIKPVTLSGFTFLELFRVMIVWPHLFYLELWIGGYHLT